MTRHFWVTAASPKTHPMEETNRHHPTWKGWRMGKHGISQSVAVLVEAVYSPTTALMFLANGTASKPFLEKKKKRRNSILQRTTCSIQQPSSCFTKPSYPGIFSHDEVITPQKRHVCFVFPEKNPSDNLRLSTFRCWSLILAKCPIDQGKKK